MIPLVVEAVTPESIVHEVPPFKVLNKPAVSVPKNTLLEFIGSMTILRP